ncbi:MAG: amidase [Deltaproteobacteria bacterium]|nr:MAG: amidase [Deltaproteobacteria bacterium]
MRADALHWTSLMELAERIRTRSLSPVEATTATLERIDALDAALHSYITVLRERALEQAKQAEREISDGRYRGPLHGVPVAVKDLCFTRGVRTTCASKILADFVPDYDAAVVERLSRAGAVVLGKLNMTEFALSGYHPDRPAPVNPWAADRWPGVSSSGSGVATAAGLCFGSIGTDTGGSIRFPSAACGVVGLKPTYGRVSRYGVFPLAESLDHVGPIARRSADAAAMLAAIAGHDARDPTSLRETVPDYLASIDAGVRGVRIGVDERYCREEVDPELAEAVLGAARALAGQGAELREVEFPDVGEIARWWFAICSAEAAWAHEGTYPSRADDYGPDFRRLLEQGARVRGADYARAHAAREAFRGRLRALFEDVDLIACPSMPAPPPRLAELGLETASQVSARPLLRFTAPFDFSGSPTLSLPCGLSREGLPLSVQLVGRHLSEDLLCRAGHAYEQASDAHARTPPV